MTIRSLIKTIPCSQGRMGFKDVTSLIEDATGYNLVIKEFIKRYSKRKIDIIVGIESKGFIIGGALAYALGKGFVPIRKQGKLPRRTVSSEYPLEYGKGRIEIHKGAISKGNRVLIVDDSIVTGKIALAAIKLVEKLKGEVVECAFIISLPKLGGERMLKKAGYKVFPLVEFSKSQRKKKVQ